jgi:hypothetical protein
MTGTLLLKRIGMLLIAALLALPVSGTAASTDRVTHETIDVFYEEFVPGACGFADGLTITISGTVRFTYYFDGDGVFTRQLSTASGVYLTFAGNGKEGVAKLWAGSSIVEPLGDGRYLVTKNGIETKLTVPGEGRIKELNDVGRVVQILVDDNELVATVFVTPQYNQTGDPFDDALPVVCELLGS